MRSLKEAALRLVRDEDGPTAVEYAIMLAFIIVVVFAAVGLVGNATKNKFNDPTLTNSLTGST